jgi:hypothetical protein
VQTCSRYRQFLFEEAARSETPLRPIWRRHISNPDHRGNPQLSLMLQVQLFTHLAEGQNGGAATATAPGGVREDCVFGMTPLLIPILCKVAVTVPGT